MNDDDICECGDYRHSHEDGKGECLICRWSPSNPEQPCKEFRPEGKTAPKRLCICPSEDRRDCWTLRYYGIAGLGAPSREQDDGKCECICHDECEEYDFRGDPRE